VENVAIMKRSYSLLLPLAFASGVTALAACSGNPNNYNSANLACGAPTGQVALAYPAPGATGIPDNFAGIVFASTNGLTSSYQAVVVPAGSSQGTQLAPIASAPSPLPSPYATPSFTNPVYQESASDGYILPAATQISVYLNDLNSNCQPEKLLGTFTSQ
jgi:hypothetical protein